jgi:hypothetical protein
MQVFADRLLIGRLLGSDCFWIHFANRILGRWTECNLPEKNDEPFHAHNQ